MRRVVPVAVLMTCATFACGKSDPAATQSGAPTGGGTTVAAAPPPGAPPTPAPGGDSTGNASCDAFLAKMVECGTTPPEQIAQMRIGYRTGLGVAASAPQIIASCEQGLAMFRCAAGSPQPGPTPAPNPPAPTGPVGAYASIASSLEEARFGLALNQPTQAIANELALAKCGHPGCKPGEELPEGDCVVVSIVVMAGKSAVGWGNKPTMEGAIAELTRVCGEHGLECPVLASGCSDGGPPQVIGGRKDTIPAPIAVYRPPPRPARRQCTSDGDCAAGTRCVIRRCPGCSTCEAGGGAASDCYQTGCSGDLTCCRVGGRPICTDSCDGEGPPPSGGAAQCNVMTNDCPAGMRCVSDGSRSGGRCQPGDNSGGNTEGARCDSLGSPGTLSRNADGNWVCLPNQ